MPLFRRNASPRHRAPQPPENQPHAVPEEQAMETVGAPLSHESVVLVARLEGLADRLEIAVRRLERQSDNDGDADA